MKAREEIAACHLHDHEDTPMKLHLHKSTNSDAQTV